ncbi:MAG: hypothetical protein WDN49_22930 [Acetobacteraceae bacterium]
MAARAAAGRPLKALHPPLAASRADAATHHRLAHALLQRLPAALAYFLLNLLKPALFAVVANFALQVIVSDPGTRSIVRGAVDAYVICRVVMICVRLLWAPYRPDLRLLGVSDAGAVYIHGWMRRLTILAIFGPAFEQMLLMLGLDEAAGQAMIKMFGLVFALFLSVMTVECRSAVAAHIRGHQSGVIGILRNRVAATWSYAAVALILALWAVWAFQVQNGLSRLAHLFLGTAAVMISARLLAIVLLGGLEHGAAGAVGHGRALPWGWSCGRIATSRCCARWSRPPSW